MQGRKKDVPARRYFSGMQTTLLRTKNTGCTKKARGTAPLAFSFRFAGYV
jgi:hypothetical protein